MWIVARSKRNLAQLLVENGKGILEAIVAISELITDFLTAAVINR
jgi:hypothetical protein